MPVRRWFQHVPPVEVRAAGVALGVGVVLTGAKFLGYFLTGSAVIFSDALESIVNLAAGTFALYSLSVAHRPADASHPYGHGKIEFVSAAVEGGMILLAGLVAVVKAIDLLRSGDGGINRENLGIALLLMTAALLVNGGMGLYLIRTGRRRGSVTLEADGHHLLSDAWTSLATLVALVALRLTGWTWVDPVAAIGVGLYIGWVGVGLLRRAEAGLTDRQDDADDKAMRAVLDAHLPGGGREPTVCSYHKLRHRHAGRYHWVDFHLVVPANWDVQKGHEVATAIEVELEQAVGEGNATAHVEPCIKGKCDRCPVGGTDQA
ncbi:MAG TPA: cation diffusion facilitator family transporter [Humisphaera sp.]